MFSIIVLDSHKYIHEAPGIVRVCGYIFISA